MKSLFRSLNPLQHHLSGGTSIQNGILLKCHGCPSTTLAAREEDFDRKDDASLIERNPLVALCLTVGASVMAGTAWTAVMLWWTHQ